ncbi:MAG: HPr family phosphocarrier protein [Lachnospiraceae bacterium]
MKVTVKLDCIAAVKNFNAIVNSFETNMDLVSGKYRVDAKSIMGVFSLDLSKPLTLEIHTNDAVDIIEELNDFIVEK